MRRTRFPHSDLSIGHRLPPLIGALILGKQRPGTPRRSLFCLFLVVMSSIGRIRLRSSNFRICPNHWERRFSIYRDAKGRWGCAWSSDEPDESDSVKTKARNQRGNVED
jgi:hypothetical protein